MKKTVNGRVKAAVCTLVTLGLLTAPVAGNATPGRTDRFGCHDSKSKGYHCHEGGGGGGDGGAGDWTGVLVGFGILGGLGLIIWAVSASNKNTASINPSPDDVIVVNNGDIVDWYSDVEVGKETSIVIGFSW